MATAPSAAQFIESGNWTGLRIVEPSDYEAIRMVESHPDYIARYRNRATTPAPESFGATLWAGVLAQFVVVELSSNEAVGVVAAYDANFRSRHFSVAGFVHPAVRGAGWAAEGLVLLIDYAFKQFDFRKCYARVLEVNAASMSSVLDRVFTLEGKLRGDEYCDGDWMDTRIYGVMRQEWSSYRDSTKGLATLDQSGLSAWLQQTHGIATDVPHVARLSDVGLDSLAILEFGDLLCTASGQDVPDELIAQLFTLGDLYHWWAVLVGDSNVPRSEVS